jgi:hypothetical protein
VRRLAIADQPRDVANGDRRLLGEQLRGGRHASREQFLVKAHVAELRIRALHLTRRAGHRAGDGGKRQPAGVVARDDHAREQIQPPSACERLLFHPPHSDGAGRRGTRTPCSGVGRVLRRGACSDLGRAQAWGRGRRAQA